MKPELKIEINRLKSILESNGLEFGLSEGATTDRIAETERRIGFTLDGNLKDLWQFSNGSNDNSWFTVFSDESTPCDFPSIEDAFEQWSFFRHTTIQLTRYFGLLKMNGSKEYSRL